MKFGREWRLHFPSSVQYLIYPHVKETDPRLAMDILGEDLVIAPTSEVHILKLEVEENLQTTRPIKK